MNRGRAARKLRKRRVSARFNEAPIHESGKDHFFCHQSPFSTCFNEAPIHESGKDRS